MQPGLQKYIQMWNIKKNVRSDSRHASNFLCSFVMSYISQDHELTHDMEIVV